MPWRDTKEAVRGLLASLAFVATGLVLLWTDAPRPMAWIALAFGVLGLFGAVHRYFRPLPRAAAFGPGGGVALRDGRDYRVDVADDGFAMTHRTSNQVQRMAWADVTFVAILAIDGWPVGGISYVVHHGPDMSIEVPWDAEGNREFLATMQEKLPGFDNSAVIQESGMVEGFRQVWPAEAAPLFHPR